MCTTLSLNLQNHKATEVFGRRLKIQLIRTVCELAFFSFAAVVVWLKFTHASFEFEVHLRKIFRINDGTEELRTCQLLLILNTH